MINYDPLWETMKTRGVSQYRLIKNYGVSSGQINRLKKNAYVSTHTIEMLCEILGCRVEDIMQYERKENEEQEEIEREHESVLFFDIAERNQIHHHLENNPYPHPKKFRKWRNSKPVARNKIDFY